MVREHSARLGLFLTMFFLAVGALAQPQYEVVDLTELYGDRFTPEDINNNGVIGGHIRISPSQEQAVVIEDGRLRYLPKVDGDYWYLTDLADNGDAIGGGGLFRGYFYHDGKVVDIGVSGEHGENGFIPARGLNSMGQVVGGTGNFRPFLWAKGNLTFLDAPIDGGAAEDINESGVIAGAISVQDDGPSEHAARWTSGKYQDLDPVWSERSEVRGINEAGNIAGLAYHMNGPLTAILWRGDKAIDIGDLGGGLSEALALNDLDQVVDGAADERGVEIGFLWENGKMFSLQDIAIGGSNYRFLQGPRSINNAGQILCVGITDTRVNYLLLNPIPEPLSVIVLIFGICVTISLRNTRRG